MQVIRNHLSNRGFREHLLWHFDHSTACAAADAFEDAELAVDAFRLVPSEDACGANYLNIYGVLSAAYLQQNALMRLHSACGLGKLDLPEGAARLRTIRDYAIAHPAPNPKNGERATFIARYSVGGPNLALHIYTRANEFVREDVPISECVFRHHSDMAEVIEKIADHLNALEEQTRAEIRARGKLTGLLHNSWRYMLSKIFEAAESTDTGQLQFAKVNAEMLRAHLVEVEAGLLDRKVRALDPSHFRLGKAQLDHLGNKLDRALAGEDVSVEIITFADGVEKQFTYVANALSEVDAELEA
jgi:hypothetical protein